MPDRLVYCLKEVAGVFSFDYLKLFTSTKIIYKIVSSYYASKPFGSRVNDGYPAEAFARP